MITQALIMCQALAMAVLTLAGKAEFGYILALSLFLGIVNSIDQPARSSCVPQTIDDKKYLASALSLNSVVFNLARIIGPSLAGFVIHLMGEVGCFFMNVVAFVIVLCATSVLKLPERESGISEKSGVLDSIKEGVLYITQSRLIRTMLLMFYFLNFSLMPYIILLPTYASMVHGGDSRLVGVMLGGVGAGAILGVIYLAAMVPLGKILNHMSTSLLLAGAAFLAFAHAKDIVVGVACLVVFGFGFISTAIANNTLIQAIIDERYRGRVMSFFVMGTMGFGPIGSWCAGHIADAFGPYTSVCVSSAEAIAAGIVLFILKSGLIPEVSGVLVEKGLIEATEEV
jgi:MFS family permease